MNRASEKYFLVIGLTCLLWAIPVSAQDFAFDSTISRPVLENYLSRSISFTELLHDDLNQPRNARGVDPHDNLRLILDCKAKFIGRALMMPENDRNDWLRYAWKWIADTDPNGHLEMPGSRGVRPGNPDGPRWYWANTRSAACPNRFNTEAAIREIWGTTQDVRK